VGVAGPIIIDLVALAPLVPSGTGFTYNRTGVSLATSLLGGVANEAAFQGGITYLNIHTGTFPNGAIRGQIFSTGNTSLATGTATGTGAVTNVENVIGGAGADSLVGNTGNNNLTGGAGNDTLLGAPGADNFTGGNDDDVMIWSNGDGSDVMDG